VRDARDPEREFTKNTRHVFFIAFTSSSSFVVVVVVVFVADDDDDDETVADGETTSSIGSPSSALRARSEARTKTQRERNKKERNSEREDEAFVGLFSRASVSVCVCSFKGVQGVVQLSKRDCIFLSPGQIFLLFTDQSIRNGVSTRALRSPIYRNKAEL
jgi:hypothetical protein